MELAFNSFREEGYSRQSRYFKEELFSEVIELPKNKPNVKKILDVDIWPTIESVNLIESEKGISNEGQKLTGVKAVVEVNFNGKITYVADDKYGSSTILRIDDLKSFYVVLPKKIMDKNISDLMRANRITITPYVEDSLSRVIDNRSIHQLILVFIEAVIF